MFGWCCEEVGGRRISSIFNISVPRGNSVTFLSSVGLSHSRDTRSEFTKLELYYAAKFLQKHSYAYEWKLLEEIGKCDWGLVCRVTCNYVFQTEMMI